MNALTLFQFDAADIRVITPLDGEPLFVAKDVAHALGYSNETDAISTHCKGVSKRYPLQTAGGMQGIRVIAEPDVPRLIVKSHLSSADRFERLVFEEILPGIRKTGSYGTPGTGFDIPKSLPEALRLAANALEQKAVAETALLLCKLTGGFPQVNSGEITVHDFGITVLPSGTAWNCPQNAGNSADRRKHPA